MTDMKQTKDIPTLRAVHLGINFGGLKAVDDFNMEIGRSELVGLIGPNGPGRPRSSIFLPESTSPQKEPST